MDVTSASAAVHRRSCRTHRAAACRPHPPKARALAFSGVRARRPQCPQLRRRQTRISLNDRERQEQQPGGMCGRFDADRHCRASGMEHSSEVPGRTRRPRRCRHVGRPQPREPSHAAGAGRPAAAGRRRPALGLRLRPRGLHRGRPRGHRRRDGQALVSGRLLADITRALPPHPVDVTLDGSRLTIACGSARFSLPGMPVDDYPKLPAMPATAGTVDGAEFAAAVAQVADRRRPRRHAADAHRRPARDRRRQAHPRRHRPLPARRPRAGLDARRPVGRPRTPVLVPARALADAAKQPCAQRDDDHRAVRGAAAGGTGEGIIGFSGTTERSREPRHHPAAGRHLPAYRSLLPNEWASSAEVAVAPARRGGQAGRAGHRPQRPGPAGVRRRRGRADRRRRRRGPRRGAARGRPTTASRSPPRSTRSSCSTASARWPRPRRGCCSRPRPSRSCCGRWQAAATTAENADYTYLIMPVRLPG